MAPFKPLNKKKPPTSANIAHSRQEQKALRVQRQSQKTSEQKFEMIQSLKKLWERMRLKRLSLQERQGAVQDALAIAQGQVLDVIFKHDSSRVIQSLLKHGTSKHRQEILKELSGHYIELSKSPYGRFVVLKALKYAPTAAIRHSIINEFTQDIALLLKLLRHQYAALVVDTIYCVYAGAQERDRMIEAFYGTEYALAKQSVLVNDKKAAVNLQSVLNNCSPDQRTRILQQLKDHLQEILKKEGNIGKNEITHRIFYEYLNQLSLSEIQQHIMDPVAAPFHSILAQLPTFVHTKAGSQLSMLLIRASTAKERKIILKAVKPHAKNVLCNEFGWAVFSALIHSVDDTVLLKQSLLNECFINNNGDGGGCRVLIRDEMNARRFIIYFLAGGSTKFFSPDQLAHIHTAMEFVKQTSKKEGRQRSKEVSKYLMPALVQTLTDERVLHRLLCDFQDAQVLVAFLTSLQESGERFELNGNEMDLVCDAIVGCLRNAAWVGEGELKQAAAGIKRKHEELSEESENEESESENAAGQQEQDESEQEQDESEQEQDESEQEQDESEQEQDESKESKQVNESKESKQVNAQYEKEMGQEQLALISQQLPHPLLHKSSCRILKKLCTLQPRMKLKLSEYVNENAMEIVKYMYEERDDALFLLASLKDQLSDGVKNELLGECKRDQSKGREYLLKRLLVGVE